MKLKITIALTIFTLYLFGQQTNKITVPAMYSTHKMKYFIVEEFQTKHKEFEIYDPTNILEEIYSKDNLINLSNTRYTEWPFEAREFPERILFVETTIDKVGKCARLQLIERDFNKNILKIDSENPKAFLRISKEKCSEIITSFFKNSANKMRQNTIDNKYTVLISKEYIVSRDSLYSNHNKPYIIQSGIKMDSIKNYYKNSESYNSIEGIYKSKDENENSIYTLGILKSSNHYNIICLDSNLEHWKEGEIKGKIPLTLSSLKEKIVWFDGIKLKKNPELIIDSNGGFEIAFRIGKDSVVYKFVKIDDI